MTAAARNAAHASIAGTRPGFLQANPTTIMYSQFAQT
jgi:hypothetical protein